MFDYLIFEAKYARNTDIKFLPVGKDVIGRFIAIINVTIPLAYPSFPSEYTNWLILFVFATILIP